MHDTPPPVLDFATDWDHTDPQWVNDPYPIWEDLRQRCPVAHTERYGGGWFPATHAGVSKVANDTVNFTSRNIIIGNGRPMEDAPPSPIGVAPPISSDPPFHQFARRLLLPAFAPGPINALEPQVRALCRRLLDEMEGQDVVNGGSELRPVHPDRGDPPDARLSRPRTRTSFASSSTSSSPASTSRSRSASRTSRRSRSTWCARWKSTRRTRATT